MQGAKKTGGFLLPHKKGHDIGKNVVRKEKCGLKLTIEMTFWHCATAHSIAGRIRPNRV
jgi:hypothetical protein